MAEAEQLDDHLLSSDEHDAWVKLAELCGDLHVRWYASDKPHSARPRLFDYWRPLCSSAGTPIEAGVVTWHELEVGVSWYSPSLELRVVIPDGTRVTVTDRKGPWNAVARDAFAQLQTMAQDLATKLPPVKPKMKVDPQAAAARQRLRIARRIMASHLPDPQDS
jgi:hypothetical protein